MRAQFAPRQANQMNITWSATKSRPTTIPIFSEVRIRLSVRSGLSAEAATARRTNASKSDSVTTEEMSPTSRLATKAPIDAVPRNLIRMAQSFNVPFPTIVRKVIWPGALPAILAGFRITASVALLLVVSAEMIGAQYGIGAFVLQAGNLMQTDQLLAGVVILSVFGLVVGKVIGWLETRLLHWR